MRIRVLGQSVPASIAAIALVEATLSFVAVYAAALTHLPGAVTAPLRLERELGPLWPGAMLLSATVVICVLAFGLYSARQRAQPAGILVRLVAALLVAWLSFWIYLGGSQASGVIRSSVPILLVMFYICRNRKAHRLGTGERPSR